MLMCPKCKYELTKYDIINDDPERPIYWCLACGHTFERRELEEVCEDEM